MIGIGGLKCLLGDAEVLIGVSSGSVIYTPILFLDVTLPIKAKCTQLAMNVIRTLPNRGIFGYFEALCNPNVHVP